MTVKLDAPSIMEDCLSAVEQVLLQPDPSLKANQSIVLNTQWQRLSDTERESVLAKDTRSEVVPLDEPGRPDKPELVNAKHLARRGLGTQAGRIALLHSLAHIEFNAINLALDAVYRFRDVPTAYVTDWLKVASDEGEHFLLVLNRLRVLGSDYGVLPAHTGLWDMARQTDHDILVRMALVPRILEARGLDVAPPMITKLQAQGDTDSADILQRIYTDEITHVEIGNRWFRHVCEERNLNGAAVFRDLLTGPNSSYLRSPFNDEARLQAGFTVEEMQVIREMEAEHRAWLASDASKPSA